MGGDLFLGFLSAVAFATILAVVSGLALAGASAIAHDMYASVIRKGQASSEEEVKVSRIATIGIGIVAILLGIAFEKLNLAFLVGLTFGIAASSNFPILILSIYWKGLTTRGALVGGVGGLLTVLTLVLLSPSVWVTVMGHAKAIFPYDHPALFSMPVAFLLAYIFSVTDKSAKGDSERAAFDAQYVRSETGLGAVTSSSH
jgi:cation/acetate symporter